MRVFISYSHKDDELAQQIAGILESLSVPHFHDVKGVAWGENVLAKVHTALRDCTHLLVIVSEASLQSPWVSYEIGFAVAEAKFVLPFLADPQATVPPFIRHLHPKTEMAVLGEFFEAGIASGRATKERLEQLLLARKYPLIFSPLGGRKNMQFGPDGEIVVGRKPSNEDSWRVNDGQLELVQNDDRVHSRFYYDEEQDRFFHTNDSDTNSILDQILEPVK